MRTGTRGSGEASARVSFANTNAALTEAYAVPILWYNRIMPATANVKGWNMTPVNTEGQDLADVWVDR
jgi:hypothetical protein